MSMRGGEKVTLEFCRRFPLAPLYTLAARRTQLAAEIVERPIRESLLARVPLGRRFYRQMLPLHPLFIRSLRLPADCQLLLSCDASMIKGIPLRRGVRHICYCCSPPRYIWEMGDIYASTMNPVTKVLFNMSLERLRKFDNAAAQRVDVFLSDSNFVGERIRKYYGRESTTLYPAVEIERFIHTRPRGDFDLLLGELVPYKRADIAVEAYARLGHRRLVVAGDGPERRKLEEIAGRNIEFRGRVNDDELKELVETCGALIFPQIEDFGIVPVEAQAAGRPVVAFGAGGALETVIGDGPDATGIFFHEQTSESLVSTLRIFDRTKIAAEACRRNAERFSRARFAVELERVLAPWLEPRRA
jgi:glycosyltransferase involved in cell wall biosynthesis